MDDTMICLDQVKLYAEEDTRRVVIQADSAPATMPTTGEGIDALADTAKIAPGSLMYALDTGKTYIMDSTGAWVEKKTSESGGGGGGSTDTEDAIIKRTLSGAYENDRITNIGDSGLSHCNITSVSLPKVTTASNAAFYECYSLASVSLPECTQIGSNCFGNCRALREIALPKCTRVGDSAFEGCETLETADLGNTLYMGEYVFGSCSALRTVILRSEDAVCECNTDMPQFEDNAGVSVYVPDAILSNYQSDTVWSTYVSEGRVYLYPLHDLA